MKSTKKALESKTVLNQAPKKVIIALKEVGVAMRTVVRETRDPDGGLPPPAREQWATLEVCYTWSYNHVNVWGETLHVHFIFRMVLRSLLQFCYLLKLMFWILYCIYYVICVRSTSRSHMKNLRV
jgi:hypothetical protein